MIRINGFAKMLRNENLLTQTVHALSGWSSIALETVKVFDFGVKTLGF